MCCYLPVRSILIAVIILMACLLSTATILTQSILFLFGFIVFWHVADRGEYMCRLQAVHSILMTASVFMVSIITTATIASRPISNFVGSMVSCRVADISKSLWGVQLVHSILMAAISLIVSLVSIQPIYRARFHFYSVPWSLDMPPLELSMCGGCRSSIVSSWRQMFSWFQ